MRLSLYFLLLITTTYYFSPSISSPQTKLLVLPLTHSLSTSNVTNTHHLLKSTSTRSSARFHRHHHRHHHHHHRQTQLSLPLSAGSDYTLSLSLSSSSSITLYLDTGSDLVWFPCKPFTCILCESKPTSPTPPATLSTAVSAVSCASSACSAAHSSSSSADLCAVAHCPLDYIETSDCGSYACPDFYYAYGDGSLIARLLRDSVTLPFSPSRSLTFHNFTFGCAHTTLAEPIGVAGFGRGVLSLPAQLAAISPPLGNSFSYCLVSHSFDSERVRYTSPLIIGRNEDKEKRVGSQLADFVYTRMIDNPKHPYFYSVGLTGISVGKQHIPAPALLRKVGSDGSGGMVVDSGTTFTMLPAGFYDSVVTEFDRRLGRVHKRASQIEETTGLGPCYYYDKTVNVPILVLHFKGNGSSVVLPRRNYFYEFLDGGDGIREKMNVGCFMLMNGGDESELTGGPGATLGNYQQQGFEVVYDLGKRRVGFAERECASLLDDLNQG